MRRPAKILGGILTAVLLSAGLTLYLQRNRLARSAVLQLLEHSTGVQVGLERIRLRPLRLELEIEGLVLANPPGFPEGEAIRVSRLQAVASWRSLLPGVTRLRQVVLEVPNVTMVRRRDGTTNLEAYVRRHTPGIVAFGNPRGADTDPGQAAEERGKPSPAAVPPVSSADAAPAAHPAASPSAPALGIGELRLHLGTLRVLDYSLGGELPFQFACQVNQEHVLRDVTHLEQAIDQLTADLLGSVMPATFKEVVGLGLAPAADRTPPRTGPDDPSDLFSDMLDDEQQ
jgi:uncharacterized protein involved in outer membrane biogenesis